MLGNPVGLFDKVGVGFLELAREPYLGMQHGPQGVILGLSTGVQGVVKGVIGGGFHSISAMTGTMYSVIKQTSGGEDTRSDNAENIA